MKRRLHSLWISFKMTPLFGINACGYGSDRESVRTEMEGAEAILREQPRGSVLVDLDIAQTELCPEIVAFLQAHAGQPDDPIRKLAIVGVSPTKRWWWQWRKKVVWPKHARFFEGHEPAKAWLVGEEF